MFCHVTNSMSHTRSSKHYVTLVPDNNYHQSKENVFSPGRQAVVYWVKICCLLDTSKHPTSSRSRLTRFMSSYIVFALFATDACMFFRCRFIRPCWPATGRSQPESEKTKVNPEEVTPLTQRWTILPMSPWALNCLQKTI